MKDLDTILHHVLPFAPECPEPTALHHLREAAIAFCERTRIWREVFEGTAADPTVLVVPEGARLYEIEEAWFNGTRLDRVPVVQAMDYAEDSPGTPRWITEAGDTSVLLVPFETGDLRVTMFLTPARDASEVPDLLIDGHARTLADGALADLLMIPNQPWTNPGLAAGFGLRFSAQADRHFAANVRGKQRAPARTRPNWL